VDVMNMDPVGHSLESKFVRLPVTHAASDARARHPHAESIRIVITTRCTLAFTERHPTELAAPDDQRRIQQPTLLEITEQRRDRLIHLGPVLTVIFLDALMRIPCVRQMPAPRIELNETNASLDQPARDHTMITDGEGREIGSVTSGGFGPTAGGPIAMGYVTTEYSKPGTEIGLIVRGKNLEAEVVKPPFVAHQYFRG